MIIDHVQQQVAEQKVYTVDYSQWLATNEELTDVTTAVDPVGTSPDLVAQAVVQASKTGIELTVSGGEDLKSYSVLINITTNTPQVKTDCFVFSIYAVCGAG